MMKEKKQLQVIRHHEMFETEKFMYVSKMFDAEED